ncbi:hypothetical protein CsatB_022564 [Cannabis sativa]
METSPQHHNDDHHEEHIFRSRYGAVEVPENVTLPEFVLQGGEEYGDKVAFVDAVSGKEYTHGEVVRDTKRFGAALRSLGLRKGHVVVVVLPNVVEYAIVALGIMAAGGVFSGSNPAAHVLEIKKQVEDSGAKLIVTNASFYDKVKGLEVPVIAVEEEVVVEGAINWHKLLEAADRAGTCHIKEEVHQNDLCALPFSSGTTGLSKGVMLTHRNLVANLCSTLFAIKPEMIGQVTVLGLMPFFHIYGITGICCATLRNKGKVVVMERYDLRTFVKALVSHEVTFAPVVPPIISDLVKKPMVDEFDLTNLKLQAVMSAAAPLAPELLRAFETKFPKVHVQEVRYYNNKEETARAIDKEGWLHTGDIGYIDEDGDVFIVDRIKEMIKYKGFQVAPAELEAILLTHPSVEDAAVFPMVDEEAGEIPAACVVLVPEAKESEEEIMKYVASNVAHYKKVRVVHFVDSIPKSPSGKIMRRLLKQAMAKIHP